jgi:phage terminase large subunit
MKLIKKFTPLFLKVPESRYYLLTGGRGSSKSFHVSTFALNLTYEPGHVILFTRWTMVSAEISIIPEFTEKIELLNKQSDFTVTNNEIINNCSGSRIIYKGIKTSQGTATANLKSISGVTTWILDEAEELVDETIFDKIDLSIRKKGFDNRVIMVLNPTTKEHWIYKRFFESVGVQTGLCQVVNSCTYIHTTYLDNVQNLEQSFLDQVELIRLTNIDKYNHVIMGGWVEKMEGVIFTNWRLGLFDDTLPSIYGLDYGFNPDPLTLVRVAIDRRQKFIYVKELCYKTNLSINDIEVELLQIPKKDVILADHNENRTTKELERKGWNIRKAKKGHIIDGIRSLQDYTIIVDPASINYIVELNNYIWSDKKADLPIDKYNHLIDPTRWCEDYLTNKPQSKPIYRKGRPRQLSHVQTL